MAFNQPKEAIRPEEEKEKTKMSIKNETPLELFNRLIKSILALQKIHGYKLCKDFDEGVRIIGDTLLAHVIEKENQRRKQWQINQRKPLNIRIKETFIQRLERSRVFMVAWAVMLFMVVFYIGVLSGPAFNKPTAVPIITIEEFNELAEKCPN